MREAVRGDIPDTAGGKAFLADGALSETEIAALDRAQSVFGMQTFYNAWELDALAPNEVHAVLYMLTFYDPYTTVHDVTADPDDPDAEGAELTRTLDDFGVHPGACLYCKKEVEQPPAEFHVRRRMTLQHLAHHAKVQADALSPCDLRDFTEEELIALGWVETPVYHSLLIPNSFNILPHNFTASARLTDELLQFEKDFPRGREPGRARTAKVLIQSGEILSPFTHAMRAAGGPPSERGLAPCLEAVKRIVDWDTNRYDHFFYLGEELNPYFDAVFPPARLLAPDTTREDRYQAMGYYPTPWHPTWAWFLVDESGGQDKGIRLMNQLRALNLPAIREGWGVRFDKTAADASSALRGCCGVLLSPWDLYLHRNIGFSVNDYQLDSDARIRGFPLPEHCELKRLRPGMLEKASAPDSTPTNTHWYYFWTREHGISPDLYWEHGMSFWTLRDGSGKRFNGVILEYSCD